MIHNALQLISVWKKVPLCSLLYYLLITAGYSIIRRKDSLMLNLIVINIVAVLPCCGIIIAELIWSAAWVFIFKN